MAAVAVLKKKGVAVLLLLIELTFSSFHPIVFGLIGDQTELELSQSMQQSLRGYGCISKGFAESVPVALIPSEFSENVWQRIAHFAGMGQRGECLMIEQFDGSVPHKVALPGQIEQGRCVSFSHTVIDPVAQRMIRMRKGVEGRVTGSTRDAPIPRQERIVE